MSSNLLIKSGIIAVLACNNEYNEKIDEKRHEIGGGHFAYFPRF